MSEHITSNMDKSTPTASIMIDIEEKAFDKAWHSGHIDKMRLYRIPVMLTNLIQYYLRDRTFSVKIEEHFSTTRTTQAGVPQGTSDIPQWKT
ncbi:hypothetical protein Trydic_g20882 [Trypoxylus dichotomus]